MRNETYSDHSKSVDITQVMEQYKKQKSKLSPLPLQQFTELAEDAQIDLIQTSPGALPQHFLPFKEINYGAMTELKRSLQQSKLVWNSYSTALFQDHSMDEGGGTNLTKREMQLYHNKETMKRIREQAKNQHEQQLSAIQKALSRIKSHPVIKIYPSLSYQDQERQDLLKRKLKKSEIIQQTEQQKLQQRLNEQQAEIALASKHYVYSYKNDYCYWGPSSKDGSTLVAYDKKLFLYGGSGNVRVEDCVYATTDKQFYKWNPVKLEEKQINGCRTHHSASVFRMNMIIFGGEVHNEGNNGKIVSECNNDIRIINLSIFFFYQTQKKDTFDIKTLKQTGMQAPRKCHISEIVGRSLLIHGGIDQRGQFLKDMICYDVQTQKWSNMYVENNGFYSFGVAYHKSCAVLTNKQTELFKGEGDQKGLNQGIYMFGGMDKQGNYLDSFVRINVYQKPLLLEQVQTKGKGPIARCQHTMSYNDLLQFIVIYGGKNDDNTKEGFLNDIYIFDLKGNNWANVEIKGYPLPGRCGHSAACVETRLFIFGGCNYDGFVKSELVVLELESSISVSYLYQDQSENTLVRKSPMPDTTKQPLQAALSKKQEKRKEMIENLNYKNMTSFLPMPRRVSKIKKLTFFEQPSQRSPRENTQEIGGIRKSIKSFTESK